MHFLEKKIQLYFDLNVTPNNQQGITNDEKVHQENEYICLLAFYINGSVQNYSISTANAVEILQSCTKPSIWFLITYLIQVLIIISLDL